MHRLWMILVLAAWAVVGLGAGSARAGTNLAVFNFQMQSDTPQWAWLEKGLADRITTDFARGRGLQVTARDRMQAVAERVRWTPELAQLPPETIRQMQEALRIHYVVSGVFTVTDAHVALTGLVIDMNTRKEVARETVEGSADDVLSLQQQLSAKLLAWFTRRRPADILTELPAWTRSIPAARALYEGVDLYDQGRYGEAWRRFRQAGRTDPAYVEAAYWTGRMYYFMDRYEHARRAFEQFVYTDGTHPRAGDALKEYLHTYEKLDTPPETLLTVYADLAKRFPEVRIHNEMRSGTAPLRAEDWLAVKSGQILGSIGKHREAILTAERALMDLPAHSDPRNIAYTVAFGNAQRLNMLTGQVLFPRGLDDFYNAEPIRFARGRTEAVGECTWPQAVRMVPMADGTQRAHPLYVWWFVVAPSGHVFKSLRFFPVFDTVGTGEAHMGVIMHKDSYADLSGRGKWTLRDAAEKGLLFDNLPPSGLLQAHAWLTADDPAKNPGFRLRGMRAVAELQRVGDHGSLRISCANTTEFIVELDGKFARRGPGLLGLLDPGEYTVRVRPVNDDTPLEAWTGTVRVEAGQTAPVRVELPWRTGTHWERWKPCVPLGRMADAEVLFTQPTDDCPALQADDDAIRMVWSHAGDLWYARSDDANTFTPPQRLPMPIGSGWREMDPTLLRDESGRFLLAFRSDRGAERKAGLYVCWSRDFAHWSAPVRVSEDFVRVYDLLQNRAGEYLLLDATSERLTVLRSRDAYRWTAAGELPLKGTVHFVRAVQRDDGDYDVFVTRTEQRSAEDFFEFTDATLEHYRTRDFMTWSKPAEILRLGGNDIMFTPLHRDGATTLLCVAQQRNSRETFLTAYRESPGGDWVSSRRFDGLIGEGGAAGAWHGRWGYLVAWNVQPVLQFPSQAEGVFLIRGPDLAPFFHRESLAIARLPGVTLDGDLDEWRDVPALHAREAKNTYDPRHWTGPDDLSFSVRAGTDGERLLLAVDVNDAEIRLDGKQPWENDGIELYWDARPIAKRGGPLGESSGQVILPLPATDGPAAPRWFLKDHPQPQSLRAVFRRREGGYTCEISVPLAELGYDRAVRAGESLLLEVQLDDRDTAGGKPVCTYASTSGKGGAYAHAYNYALATFNGPPADEPGEE